MNTKWHKRFLDLCDHVSSWSQDPSTQVGSVIVRPNRTIASLGYNGFPRGVNDDPDRYSDRVTKYKFVCHAEANAIVSSNESLDGYTLFSSPLHPCNDCAKLIVQSGVATVVTREPIEERLKESYEAARTMFSEARVEVITYAKDY